MDRGKPMQRFRAMISLATLEREVANDPFNGHAWHCLRPSHSRGCFPSSGTIKPGYIFVRNSDGFEKCLLGAGAFLCSLLSSARSWKAQNKSDQPLVPCIPRASDHRDHNQSGPVSAKEGGSATLTLIKSQSRLC